jgi:hypothetical protein
VLNRIKLISRTRSGKNDGSLVVPLRLWITLAFNLSFDNLKTWGRVP